jgi:hypothetical protein
VVEAFGHAPGTGSGLRGALFLRQTGDEGLGVAFHRFELV